MTGHRQAGRTLARSLPARLVRHELAVRHDAHAERHESASALSRWPLTLPYLVLPIPGPAYYYAPARLARSRSPGGILPRPSHLVQRHPGRGQRGVQPPAGPGRVRLSPQVAGAKAAEASPGSARGLPYHQAGPMAANGSSTTSTRLASSSVTRPRSQAANILISAATDHRFSFPATRDTPPAPRVLGRGGIPAAFLGDRKRLRSGTRAPGRGEETFARAAKRRTAPGRLQLS